MADRIVALHDAGAAWSDCAVLCRTSRLFLSLQQAFVEREVPAEILGLAGLLKMPEVVEVLAYARATLDPLASVALGRILLGPRYRVGFKDLALVASLAKTKSYALREEDEADGRRRSVPVHRGPRASRRGRGSLRGRTGAPGGVPAGADGAPRRGAHDRSASSSARSSDGRASSPSSTPISTWRRRRRPGATWRRSSTRCTRSRPSQGELTLRAFLDYVDAVENLDKQEWSPVQPSEEDSVKVMTIHVAKGLEFDHVFVPGLAKGLLPNTTIQHNPAERGKSMDFELRGDASLPAALRRQPVRLQEGPASSRRSTRSGGPPTSR